MARRLVGYNTGDGQDATSASNQVTWLELCWRYSLVDHQESSPSLVRPTALSESVTRNKNPNQTIRENLLIMSWVLSSSTTVTSLTNLQVIPPMNLTRDPS